MPHDHFNMCRVISECITIILFVILILPSLIASQAIFPSNRTSDLYPVATSPRFLLNGTELSQLPVIRLAPLGAYAEISHTHFTSIQVTGHLVNVDASNANIQGSSSQFSYMSCDPDAYTGNLNANDVLRIVVSQPHADVVILYSRTSNHCGATGLDTLPQINGILTTTDLMLATMLADLGLTVNSNGEAVILPDLNSYTNETNSTGWSGANQGLGQGPTTAVAMIVLYAITGLITAMFVFIIVTGALRAHRHPERYGPGAYLGRGRQSRARGIARAMLDTLPIVRFGDRDGEGNIQKPGRQGQDVEMDATGLGRNVAAEQAAAVTNTEEPGVRTEPSTNADGIDAEGHLGCSICTDDFNKGEEVRVLPCNHKFHPDCVDPWLLNVSGTCPLCRIDLRPQDEDDRIRGASQDDPLAPPLAEGGPDAHRLRDTFATLRQLARPGAGNRDERIAALRRLRQERRIQGSQTQDEVETERRGLARRLRDRFRVQTERTGNS